MFPADASPATGLAGVRRPPKWGGLLEQGQAPPQVRHSKTKEDEKSFLLAVRGCHATVRLPVQAAAGLSRREST
eukprot:COSAG06_NODE_43650_length_370_cov_0.708487_1_plen_73_part_01